MKYLLMIYEDEASYEGQTEEAMFTMMAAYDAYTAALREAGVFLGGEALQPVRTATTVRVRDGRAVTTDGPFAETKEQLGGYYLIDAKDLDDAIAWAAKIPASTTGSIEVRPLMEFPEP
jgi:hypothetical protein